MQHGLYGVRPVRVILFGEWIGQGTPELMIGQRERVMMISL